MKHLEFSGIQTELGTKESFYTVNNAGGICGKDFYFLSNDVYKNKLRIRTNTKEKQYVFLGIANPHYFHVLAELMSYCQIVRMIAIDHNLAQLSHFNYIRQLICSSNNRIEYLQALFKMKFNAKAIELLKGFNKHSEGYVHGGIENDRFYDLEKTIWQNSTFDEEAFLQTYGLKVVLTEAGLKIKSTTIGDINTYFATIICCSHSDYGGWPFTAAFGSGFLRDEIIFQKVKKMLLSTPIYQIWGDLSQSYEALLFSNRYSPIIFFSSNLLCEYFIDKHPALAKIIEFSQDIGCRSEPLFPEIDLIILQDERTAMSLPAPISPDKNFKRKLSVHTKNFSMVVPLLQGNKNVEVVNMPSWIEQDKGVSKLPNTEYLSVEAFNNLDNSTRFTSVFLHILVGHGMPVTEFLSLAQKALTMSDNLIILEHNKDSKDFKKKKIGLSIAELKQALGKEKFLTFCPGKKYRDRNILATYGSM